MHCDHLSPIRVVIITAADASSVVSIWHQVDHVMCSEHESNTPARIVLVQPASSGVPGVGGTCCPAAAPYANSKINTKSSNLVVPARNIAALVAVTRGGVSSVSEWGWGYKVSE